MRTLHSRERRVTVKRRHPEQAKCRKEADTEKTEQLDQFRSGVAGLRIQLTCSIVLKPLTARFRSRFQIAFSMVGTTRSGSAFVRTAKDRHRSASRTVRDVACGSPPQGGVRSN